MLNFLNSDTRRT